MSHIPCLAEELKCYLVPARFQSFRQSMARRIITMMTFVPWPETERQSSATRTRVVRTRVVHTSVMPPDMPTHAWEKRIRVRVRICGVVHEVVHRHHGSREATLGTRRPSSGVIRLSLLFLEPLGRRNAFRAREGARTFVGGLLIVS